MRIETLKLKLEQFFDKCLENKTLNRFLKVVFCVSISFTVIIYSIHLISLIMEK